MLQQQIIPLGPPPHNPGLPEGWRTQWSAEHQQVYYSNIVTGEGAWTIPSSTAYSTQQQVVQTQYTPQKQEISKIDDPQEQVQAQPSQARADLAEHIQILKISSHPDQEQKNLDQQQILQAQILRTERTQPLDIQKETDTITSTAQEVHVAQVQSSEPPLSSFQPRLDSASLQHIPAQKLQKEHIIVDLAQVPRASDLVSQSQQSSAQPIHESPEQQQYYSPLTFQQQLISPEQHNGHFQNIPPQPQHSQQNQNLSQSAQQHFFPIQHQQAWTSSQPSYQQMQVQQAQQQRVTGLSIQQQYSQPVPRKQSVQRKPVGGQTNPNAVLKQHLCSAHEEKEVNFRTSSVSSNQPYQLPPTNKINHGNNPGPPEPAKPQPQQGQYIVPPHTSHLQQHHPPTAFQSPHSPQQIETGQYTPPISNQVTPFNQAYNFQYPPVTRHSSIPQQQSPQTLEYPSIPIPLSYQQQPQRHFSAPHISYQQQQKQPKGHFSLHSAQTQQYPVPPASTSPQTQQQPHAQFQPQQIQTPSQSRNYTPLVVSFLPPPQRPTIQAIVNPNAHYLPKPRPQSQLFSKPNFKINSSSNSSSSSSGGMMTKFSSKLTAMRKTVGPGSTASPVVKWGSRAALSLGAIGAMALGVDGMDGGIFDGDASMGNMGGGGDFSGGGGGFGGGDTEGVSDANTALDASYAENAMALQGQENALQLLDPPGTTYETVLI